MRPHRRVQLLAIFCAWIVASFVLYSQASWKGSWYECLWSPFPISSGEAAFTIPTYVLALLTSGGAAFWNSILDFTKAAKQIKEQRLVAMRLNNDVRMAALHLSAPPHPWHRSRSGTRIEWDSTNRSEMPSNISNTLAAYLVILSH